MRLRKVKLDTIKVPEVRVTARMDEDMGFQFAESIKTVGIDEPIKCFDVEGELVLSDGLHRLLEAKRQGIEFVEVYVRPGTMADVLCNNLASGYLRGKHPVSEMRKSILALQQEFNMDSEAIAAKTGLTRSRIETMLELNDLGPQALEALDSGKIGVGIAHALTMIKDPIGQEIILNDAIVFNRSIQYVKDVVNEAIRLSSGPGPAPVVSAPYVPSPVPCQFCQGNFPPTEVRTVIVCPGCFGQVYGILAELRRRDEEASQAGKPPTPSGSPGSTAP